ncbi:hypothetical protein [Rhizobium sp. BK491]|uniref:hypothetical protein n=1 Tax=Rhizobium sp. BK491 TaxID=2587009 RepID=UPI00183AD646|nr:hypothetical protein [Rhizobium sp. BK491]MBB3566028.1 hypothetical protein [Rhizobium sp. BK491]
MGELPLWHKQKSGIGAMMLPTRGKNRCLPREIVNRTIFDFHYRKTIADAALAAGRDRDRTNAGLDIIASYARKCGKQHRLDATGAALSKGDPVSCAIRENIRETDGVCASAVTGPNGAKEIDCYV